MSLHNAAKYLQSKGRGNDKMLVHMTPKEVQGLQKLALASGGSLSINPDTGLVEAGWLENLLPVIAGVALNAFLPGAGAAVGSALGTSAAVGTGALVGGATTLITGDLNKGLTAGLGAWGGAGLGEGLAGTAQAQSGMAEGAKALGTTPEAIATPQGFEQAISSPSTYEGADIMTSHVTDPSKVQTFADAYQRGAAPAETGMGRLGQAGEGLKAVSQGATPAGGSLMMPALGAAAPMLNEAMQPDIPGRPQYEGGAFTKKRLSPSFQGFTPARPNPYYRPMGLGYTFAAGGLADITMAEGGQFDDSPGVDAMASGGIARFRNRGMVAPAGMRMGEGIARDTDEDTASLNAMDAAKKRMQKNFAAARMPVKPVEMPKTNPMGMASGGLGSYSDGGRMLKGPGDGMSDSIPATIGRKQPARLADGEFVVPADVVSHLGNGSTDAGAKKLYGMMDKIRKARTGKKKQAPAVKADKYMPV